MLALTASASMGSQDVVSAININWIKDFYLVRHP